MRLSSLARAFAERTTRKWGYARRLPTSFGSAPIFVTPAAGLKFLLKPMPEIDPILLRNVIELVRPSDVVWDIGANYSPSRRQQELAELVRSLHSSLTHGWCRYQ